MLANLTLMCCETPRHQSLDTDTVRCVACGRRYLGDEYRDLLDEAIVEDLDEDRHYTYGLYELYGDLDGQTWEQWQWSRLA